MPRGGAQRVLTLKLPEQDALKQQDQDAEGLKICHRSHKMLPQLCLCPMGLKQ